MMRVGGIGMLLLMVLFWLFVVGGALWLLSRLFPRSGSSSGIVSPRTGGSRSPLEIVRERYARGEISRAEYEQIRRDLET